MSNHWKLLHAITEYDKRQARGKRYNRFALPQYMAALETAEAKGEATKASLCGTFCGRLLDNLLKAIGEAPSTDDEQRMRF